MMSKDQVKEHLSKYGNLVELIREASVLKSNGENETYVNKAVAELRKEMLSANKAIKVLHRTNVPEVVEQTYGFILSELKHLNQPVIEWDGETAVL